MRVAKIPMPPDIGHYAVTIIVVDIATGHEVYSGTQRVPAVTVAQAIHRGGMRIVNAINRLLKEAKENG